MKIDDLGGPFGAEVAGLDLRDPLAPSDREAIGTVFAENVVLCFRDQQFETPDEFIAAASTLGDPMPPIVATYRLAGYDVVEELSNDATDKRTGDGKPLKRGGSWHSDHSNLETPPKATVLFAIEVPDGGGNTEFVNMFHAYDALPQSLKDKVDGLLAFQAYLSRRAPRKLLKRNAAEEAESPGAWQPLVRAHPETGRKALFLNPMRIDAVEGMEQKEADELLDTLYAHCDDPAFRYSHKWRPGDMLIWDNRSSMHRATFDFDPAKRRYLHRIMLKGDKPVLAA